MTEKTMITKVAMAICESAGDDWFREGPSGLVEAYGPQARAAIGEVLAVVAVRKAIYEAKRDAAWADENTDKWERMLHTIEAFEYLESELGADEPSNTDGETE